MAALHYFSHYCGTMSKLFGNVAQLTYRDIVYLGLKRNSFYMGAFVHTYCEVQ